jgi:hypothetical protein
MTDDKGFITCNSMIDLGDEKYTKGRPHPFIDHRLRFVEIQKAFADKNLAILLLDIALGWGSHPDPAGEVVNAVNEAKKNNLPHNPVIICSIIGTEDDYQGLTSQKEKLIQEKIIVAESNTAAVLKAIKIHKFIKDRNEQ